MDYKVIIILLVLLFLIILVYREVSTFREQISKTINNVLLQFSDTNDRSLLKFQNNINKCVAQIKTISSDNIQQLQKINTLNHQQIIRKGTNHFTEIEGEGRPDLQPFSDYQATVKENKTNNIFEKKEADNYYMSDDTHKKTKDTDAISEDAERSSKLAKQKMICEDDKCYIKKEDELTTTIPVYNPPDKEIEHELPLYVSSMPKQIVEIADDILIDDVIADDINKQLNNDHKNKPKTDLEKVF